MAADPRPASVRARPTCRDRSPIPASVFEFAEDGSKRSNGCSSRRGAWIYDRRRDQSLPDGVGELDIVHPSRPSLARRGDLRDDPVAIGHEHGLPTLRHPHVLAQSVLQHLETNGSHDPEVASSSYFVKRGYGRSCGISVTVFPPIVEPQTCRRSGPVNRGADAVWPRALQLARTADAVLGGPPIPRDARRASGVHSPRIRDVLGSAGGPLARPHVLWTGA